MKKKLLIIAFLIHVTISNGQIVDRISFNYGITSSDLQWEFEQDPSLPTLNDLANRNLNGFYSGIDIDYLKSRFFALSTGIGFYQKGAKYDWGNRASKLDLSYLTFDTKVKVKYDFNKFTPYLVIGPRIDYLLQFSSAFDDFDRLGMMNKINYGLRYGLGIQYDFGKIILGLAWKNDVSFNSIVDNNGEYMNPPFTIKDKTMFFNLDFGIKM
jgi:hypothetical protein